MITRERSEIETLKKQWCDDPCWDIEDTEGFEAHYDELREFSELKSAEWEKQEEKKNAARKAELSKKIEDIGVEGILDLVEKLLDHVADLEYRVKELECYNQYLKQTNRI